MADLVLVADVTAEQLRARRTGDRTRRRRSFDLHVRLREPLTSWYAALDRLDPGRVVWNLPVDGHPFDAVAPRPDRCEPTLLDALLRSLPTA